MTLLRKPDEPTRQGTYVWYGWLVALRPRLMQLARLVPGLVTVLITTRAIVLAAVSMPATTGIVITGIAVEGSWFPRTGQTIQAVWGFVSTVGVLNTLWLLVIGKLAFTLWMKRQKVQIELPWALITNLSTLTFVVWPVVTSSYGWMVPIVWGLELYVGSRKVQVRKWRLAWSIRRRWPMVWTLIDTTTADPQASFGGGISAFFAQARTIPRPVFNHPAMSWWMDFTQYGRITFWIFAPNGTTLQQLEDKTSTISQQFGYVAWVDLDHRNDSSWARLTFGLTHSDDILAEIELAIEDEMVVLGGGEEEPGMAEGEPEEPTVTLGVVENPPEAA